MFVPKLAVFKFFFVLIIIEILENVFKTTIVFFKDGIFSAQVKRIVSIQSVFETRVSEIYDWLISIVHAHQYTSSIEVEYV